MDKKNIDTYLKEKLIIAASSIEKTMQEEYKESIDKFYNDYRGNGKPPLYYRRTKFLKDYGSDYDNMLNHIKSTKDGYEITLDVGSRFYPSNPYKTKSLSWVFDNAFGEGIHGIDSDIAEIISIETGKSIVNVPHKMDPTPNEILESKLSEESFYPIVKKEVDVVVNEVLEEFLANVNLFDD